MHCHLPMHYAAYVSVLRANTHTPESMNPDGHITCRSDHACTCTCPGAAMLLTMEGSRCSQQVALSTTNGLYSYGACMRGSLRVRAVDTGCFLSDSNNDRASRQIQTGISHRSNAPVWTAGDRQALHWTPGPFCGITQADVPGAGSKSSITRGHVVGGSFMMILLAEMTEWHADAAAAI